MIVLVACEESQRVATAFRAMGHIAFSCDVVECSGGHPEYHIRQDVLPLLNGNAEFRTEDGTEHRIVGRWDLIIAHPPCTYLTVSGNRWFNVERYGEKAIKRQKERQAAYEFFMRFVTADCDRIAIENPIGYMNTHYRKPDQIIQPYEFGHPTRKATCLWLKGLEPLKPTNIVEPELISYQLKDGRTTTFGKGIGQAEDENGKKYSFNDPMTAKIRSKTFEGIAQAMGEQWG